MRHEGNQFQGGKRCESVELNGHVVMVSPSNTDLRPHKRTQRHHTTTRRNMTRRNDNDEDDELVDQHSATNQPFEWNDMVLPDRD